MEVRRDVGSIRQNGFSEKKKRKRIHGCKMSPEDVWSCISNYEFLPTGLGFLGYRVVYTCTYRTTYRIVYVNLPI